MPKLFKAKFTEFEDKKYMKKVTPADMLNNDREELYKRTVLTKVELNNAREEGRVLKTRLMMQT